MARYIGPACRLCRREGTKLFLKGSRCLTEKCAIDRRSYPPGQHGQGRQRFSEYSLQLREKQKLKRIYGLLERQFRQYFHRADQRKGVTGENLLVMLESRLDNVAYRLGFAASRKQSRMLVRQNHFYVNGNPVNIPSFLLDINDVVEVREKSREILPIKDALEGAGARNVPSWLDLDKAHFKGTIKARPSKDEIALPVNEQLVVELYSR
ncbi:MAG: 30S ribosomal protein S4 [Nitrospira sp.]|nr:30S ribosomal protein S4 [Candidatus Manganitrophaceae bacterium]HIL35501.1 30S ribosomal protein S4 [Candidatus Manganitrophaceae bacterium]